MEAAMSGNWTHFPIDARMANPPPFPPASLGFAAPAVDVRWLKTLNTEAFCARMSVLLNLPPTAPVIADFARHLAAAETAYRKYNPAAVQLGGRFQRCMPSLCEKLLRTYRPDPTKSGVQKRSIAAYIDEVIDPETCLNVRLYCVTTTHTHTHHPGGDLFTIMATMALGDFVETYTRHAPLFVIAVTNHGCRSDTAQRALTAYIEKCVRGLDAYRARWDYRVEINGANHVAVAIASRALTDADVLAELEGPSRARVVTELLACGFITEDEDVGRYLGRCFMRFKDPPKLRAGVVDSPVEGASAAERERPLAIRTRVPSPVVEWDDTASEAVLVSAEADVEEAQKAVAADEEEEGEEEEEEEEGEEEEEIIVARPTVRDTRAASLATLRARRGVQRQANWPSSPETSPCPAASPPVRKRRRQTFLEDDEDEVPE